MKKVLKQAFAAKKHMRTILIVLSMMSVMSITAQSFTQRPSCAFRSTSTMAYSGTSLPLAAQSGVQVTGTTPGSFSYASNLSGPRRIGGSGSGTGGNGAQESTDPSETPLGDALLPMMLMAMLFAAFITLRRKRSERVNG